MDANGIVRRPTGEVRQSVVGFLLQDQIADHVDVEGERSDA